MGGLARHRPGLAEWQADAPQGAAAGPFRGICIDPPRSDLREAIAERFAAMIAAGGVDEVAALLALGLDPALPAMRAHGVPELAAYLRGEITLAEAQARACLATGQYTKRQATWFRPGHCCHRSRRRRLMRAYIFEHDTQVI